jgi:O-succinylbenzoic acid--CoA ligase
MPSVRAVPRLVALVAASEPRAVEELWRTLEDGDAVLPIDPRLADAARNRVIAAMAPSAFIDERGGRHELERGAPVEEGDALVMATSGTTGEPKGVVLTHDAIFASARATSARIAVDPTRDRWWACLPLAHIGGLAVVLRAQAMGVGCEVGGFSAEAASGALERGATLTSLVPTALRRLDTEAVSAFRCIVLGGQAPPSGLPPNVLTTYGMTETGSGVVYDGIPLDGVEVALSESSEILLRGPMLLRCYRDGRDPKTHDGWFATGDAGSFGPDGRLSVHGRIEDLVITGGENVWPGAVEPLVERHPAVLEAAVAGRPDPEWGERVTAFLVVSGEVEAAALLGEIRDLVRDELAGYAAPREIVLVDELPRTPLGKVRREALSGLEGPSASL